MKEFVKIYNDSSTWFKILICSAIILCVVFTFKPPSNKVENFETSKNFEIKLNEEIYDGFYANIYDQLVFNNIRTEYEIGQIINSTTPTNESMILDIGCGTGHHEHGFNERGYNNIVGIDKSKEMIKKAQENYPSYTFQVADIMNDTGFPFNNGTFTHILCIYFTIYYIQDKQKFFKKCFKLLKPGGYLVVHLVDRNRFDPILPPGNPFYFLSPQNYTTDRITSTKLDFNGFEYSANFDLDKSNNIAKFEEKFKDKQNGKVRVNEHKLYMETLTSILQYSQDVGFIIHAKIDMMKCAYDYQYLYVFYKPA